MVDRGEPGGGDPLDRPAIYRTLGGAFAVWAAHFTLSYAAVLVFPDQPIARIVAIAAAMLALGILMWLKRKLPQPLPNLAIAALALSAAGIAFGTFPAIIG